MESDDVDNKVLKDNWDLFAEANDWKDTQKSDNVDPDYDPIYPDEQSN